MANKIECCDTLEWMKKQDDFSADIIFSDPPYNLGSTTIIREDGAVDYSNKRDFMGKWDAMSGDWWKEYMAETFRALKHGGYCVMYGMDRQLLLFKYYAALAGFSERQSMYWYFCSSFPKSCDMGKMLDRNAGEEREVIGIRHDGKCSDSGSGCYAMNNGNSTMTKDVAVTKPKTNLAKKYDGYKYSCSPLKQTNETIMVFQKPYKTGSCLHDTLAYEAGDATCLCGALAIEDGR